MTESYCSLESLFSNGFRFLETELGQWIASAPIWIRNFRARETVKLPRIYRLRL